MGFASETGFSGMLKDNEQWQQQLHIQTGVSSQGEDVEGTNVFDMSGHQIGSVDHLMIDKVSGRAAFGGYSASATVIIRYRAAH
jgi:hypothetical protein